MELNQKVWYIMYNAKENKSVTKWDHLSTVSLLIYFKGSKSSSEVATAPAPAPGLIPSNGGLGRTFQPKQYSTLVNTWRAQKACNAITLEGRGFEVQGILNYVAVFHSLLKTLSLKRKIYRIHLHRESNLETTKNLKRQQRSCTLATVQLQTSSPLVIREEQTKTTVRYLHT